MCVYIYILNRLIKVLLKTKITQVLEKICPPYSLEFASLFLPIVENDEVTGTMRCGDGENDPVSEFIGNKSIIIVRLSIIYVLLLLLSSYDCQMLAMIVRLL